MGDEREVVFVGLFPVNNLQGLMRILARILRTLFRACSEPRVDLDAIFEQGVDLFVGGGETEQAAALCQLLDGLVDEGSGNVRVEGLERGAQAGEQHYVACAAATRGAAGTVLLLGTVDERVAQSIELLAGALAYCGFTAYALHVLLLLSTL